MRRSPWPCAPRDPALLHYRSGAFYLARAGQAGRDGVPDVMQGVAAAIDEPIAGGRHKVFGNHELAVIPQTSTIASHLPRAMGVAIAIDRARKLGVECSWPDDAVVVCSFGDASLNHATAQAALNTTAHAAHQHLPVPLLFVCEDNGIGISVPSPAGWVANALSSRASLRYETADGDDPAAALAAARDAGRLGAGDPAPGGAPPAHRSLPRPCRRRRRGCVPHARCRAGRSRARPVARHRPLARGRGSPHRRRARSRLPRGERARPRGRARRGTAAAARERRRGDAAARAPLAGRGRQAGSGRRGHGGAGHRAAHARPRDQRGARRRARRSSRGAPLRRGHRREGRRLRRHPRPARALRRRAACSTRCSTRRRSSASRSAPR